MDSGARERLESQLRWTKRMEVPNSYDCTLEEILMLFRESGTPLDRALIHASQDGQSLLITVMECPIE